MTNPTRGHMGGPLLIWQGAVMSDRHLFGFTTFRRGASIAAYMPDNSVFPPMGGMIAYPDCIAFHSPVEDQEVEVTVEEWDRTPPPFTPQEKEWRLAGEVTVRLSEAAIRGDGLVAGPSDLTITLDQGPGLYRARAWVKGTDEAVLKRRAHARLYSYNEEYLLQLWPAAAEEGEE